MSSHRENCRRARYILICLGATDLEKCTSDDLTCSWPEHMSIETFEKAVKVLTDRAQSPTPANLDQLLRMAMTDRKEEAREAYVRLRQAVLLHDTESLVAKLQQGPAAVPTAFLLDLLEDRRTDLRRLAEEAK